MHSLKPRDPVVLIRYSPNDRVDPEVRARVKEAVRRVRQSIRNVVSDSVTSQK